MAFWSILVDSFRESLDRKIFWVMIAMSFLIAGAMACIGFDGENVSLLFGVWTTETEGFNPATAIGAQRLRGVANYFVVTLFLGWMGMILMIIATASFFPNLMEPGTIDVLVSKPIGRTRLFFYKYFASMVFVFVQSTVFILLTFLVMGLRWQVWSPGYLVCIPLMVLLFSYVYCVTVWVAVKTRSVIASILLTLVAWVAFACPQIALDVFDTFPAAAKYERVHKAIKIVAWIPPKTGDIPYLAGRTADTGLSVDLVPDSAKSSGSPRRTSGGPRGPVRVSTSSDEDLERARKIEAEDYNVSAFTSIGSSLLFEFAVLLLACRSFVKKDF